MFFFSSFFSYCFKKTIVDNCSRNGICNKYSICECFNGFIGPECSLRSCATGSTIAAIADTTNSSSFHSSKIVCSNKGSCNHETGLCECFTGFTGLNCGKMSCMNNCNNHGTCVNLQMAAKDNNGYHFNRTTVYNQWDSELFQGCNCDVGWSGSDCSERACPYGPDPRITTSAGIFNNLDATVLTITVRYILVAVIIITITIVLTIILIINVIIYYRSHYCYHYFGIHIGILQMKSLH